ncbi:DEAD/DEAH box helicase [Brumimicrobium aurantiacum]|uniref:DEAD/DEAH box helicase n=1 Tax=Brumimicrobium aurantiacum TaxID=1737063 RepID=A0A3E1EWT2_9FLAO|nr:DEAD/DEAH box helicase [Brumimicrobium aurantiacum]RFC54016.1 DEAD/DEAH box helicase [Brumimicrobium aurantiacum]
MKFDDYKIAKVIKKEIQNLGWKRPTDIQFKAIQPILNGEDVLAIAQTGTGKTASFVIPILNAIHNQLEKNPSHYVRALVMVPTRELAEQVEKVFAQVGKGVDVRSRSLMGGVSQDDQITDLDNGVDVVISTPGRMFDLISQGVLKVDRLQTLVLDEADHMLDLGFIKDIEDLMRHIPQKRQTLFFSATIDKKIKKIAYNLVRNAIRIQISPKDPVAKNIEHAVTFVEMDDKRFFLENIIKENKDLKIMVFVRTKVRAERVVKAMERVNIEAITIHGDVEQKDRFKVLEKFKNNEVSILVATDVAARGIDIPGIGAVINYDLPEEPENYTHRVGRTGRGKEKGVAISFCSESEKILLKAIEAYNGTEIAVFDLSKQDYSAIIDDSEDGTDNWRKLIEEENKRAGTGNEW